MDKIENYKVYERDEIGSVYIAKDVVANIVAIATLEVEGVFVPFELQKSRQLVEKNINKIFPRKIKTSIVGDFVYIDISITIMYGYTIAKVCKKVQEKIKNSVENMTGMKVEKINVHIANIEAK